MKKKLTILFLTVLALGALGYFLYEPAMEYIEERKRAAYIQSVEEELLRFQPEGTKPAELDSDGEHFVLLADGKSFLKLADGTWIYIISRSIHADHDSEFMIGDIQLAVDNSGVIYRGNSHWCGAMFLSTNKVSRSSASQIADILEFKRSGD